MDEGLTKQKKEKIIMRTLRDIPETKINHKYSGYTIKSCKTGVKIYTWSSYSGSCDKVELFLYDDLAERGFDKILSNYQSDLDSKENFDWKCFFVSDFNNNPSILEAIMELCYCRLLKISKVE